MHGLAEGKQRHQAFRRAGDVGGRRDSRTSRSCDRPGPPSGDPRGPDEARRRGCRGRWRDAVPFSASVYDRRRHGAGRKQDFYRSRLFHARWSAKFAKAGTVQDARPDQATRLASLLSAKDPFAYQLPSIAETGNDGLLPGQTLRPSLTGKIALLYMDGNGFGKIQAAVIEAAGDPLEAQRRFDTTIQTLRRDLLMAMLVRVALGETMGLSAEAEGEPAAPAKIAPAYGLPTDLEYSFREEYERDSDEPRDVCRDHVERGAAAKSPKIIRFETLLWRGDEMMFAVPARLGWDIADLVCQHTAKWRIAIDENGASTMPLDHAVGPVFCHDIAPIGRIRELARGLADHAKEMRLARPGEAPKNGAGRNETFVMPMVLESFDHLGNGLDDYLNRRAPVRLRSGAAQGDRAEDERNRFFACPPPAPAVGAGHPYGTARAALFASRRSGRAHRSLLHCQ